jgi:hypothetical protein
VKTAVLLSGQARTFGRCFPNLKWQVFDKLESPHFFVSVARDADAPSVEILRTAYPNAPVHIDVVEQPLLPEPAFASCLHAPYAITPTRTPGVGPLQGILRALWHYSRAWKFAQEHGAKECDVFVRCRPDLHFHRVDFSPYVYNSGYERAVMHMGPTDAYTPYWGHYGPGTNDRFAIMGKTAAKAYLETYDVLPQLLAAGIPFHPETLVGAALERAGCTISRTLLAEFAFCRKPDREHADYWFEHMQVLPGELAEWIAHLSKQ